MTDHASLIELAPIPLLAVSTEDGSVTVANQLARDILGYQAGQTLLKDRFEHPELARQLILMTRNQGHIRQFEARLVTKQGNPHWFLISARYRHDMHRAELTFVDIHDRKQEEERNRRGEARLRAILATTSEGYALIDGHSHRILDANPALCQLLGSPRELLVGHLVEHFLKSSDNLRSLQAWRKSEAPHWSGELQLHTPGGENRQVHANLSRLEDPDSVNRGPIAALFTDITERKLNEERILTLAFYDTLTALPNRFLIQERLDQAILQYARGGRAFTLMFIDLDDFKQVNDQHGHEAGDWLLQQAAHRLVKCVRTSDTVSRLSGDEFLILLTHTDNDTSAELVATKIVEQLSKPFNFGPHALQIGVSIGIARYPDHADNAAVLRKHADEAMYAAKHAGKNTFRIYRTPA